MNKLSLNCISEENHLKAAFQSILAKGATGGIDNISVTEYQKSLSKNIKRLSENLRVGKWKPQPYLGLHIHKKSGGTRTLGLLSVEDKVVQTSIKFYLEPVIDHMLNSSSYAYRSGRGHVKAVRRTLHESSKKWNTVYLRTDIKDFFDSIDRDILMNLLSRLIKDTKLLSLIRLCLTMGRVNPDMSWQESPVGIPQGAILSPLLSNLYLTSFDTFVSGITNAYIRYADDCVCWFKDEGCAQAALEAMRAFLQNRLKLQLNDKVRLGRTDSVPMTYLGLDFYQGKIFISDSKKQELSQSIGKITIENGALSSKYLKTLDGIRRYYAKVLPNEFSGMFDVWLKDAIKSYVVKGHIKKKEAFAIFGDIDGYAEKDLIRNWINEAVKDSSYIDTERKVIASRKREYQRRESENSELIVNTPGCFLGLSGRGITLRKNGQPVRIPPSAALKHITIMSQGVSMSSNLIGYCMENDIAIDFFDLGSRHIGSILAPKYMFTSMWKSQILLDELRRNEIGRRIIMGKVKNQSSLAKYFNKYHKTVGVQDAFLLYDDTVQTLLVKIKNIKNDQHFKSTLMGLEASAASAYWEYVRALIEDDNVGFYSRVKQGATDLVNSLLNYGYAMLYPRIWQAALRHKLNPYIGFVHYADSQANLVFDMIELFRCQCVDRIVIALIQKKEELKLLGGKLDEPTKVKLAKHIAERFNRREKYRGESRRFMEIIDLQFGELCDSIAEGVAFRPYLAKW